MSEDLKNWNENLLDHVDASPFEIPDILSSKEFLVKNAFPFLQFQTFMFNLQLPDFVRRGSEHSRGSGVIALATGL